ncbi:hypothetical protein BC832DRAFT_217798 [Gaertneriomyces semiglobifer]|nr:hypothetical protein BC832DRAFT_217798 [Gaertneriomyces semiglobifer]
MLPRLRPPLGESRWSTVTAVAIFPQAPAEIALKMVDVNKVEHDVLEELFNELDAYEYLEELQGSVIPGLRAYGCMTGGAFLVLGTELLSQVAHLGAAHKDKFSKVREAYSRLHAAGIVHGDVAPRNILVTTEPERPVVLVDFGRAREATMMDVEREQRIVEDVLQRLGDH